MSPPEFESKDSDAELSPPLLSLHSAMKDPAPRKPFIRTLRGKLIIGISTLLVILIALSLGLTLGFRARDNKRSTAPEDAAPSSVVINLSSTAPSTANSLDPALVSFSIEQDRWTDWTGISKPNQFVLNVLGNLKNKTGSTPWIRVGADSEDRTMFNSSIEYSRASYEDPSYLRPYPESKNITVGPAYYSLVSHLPPNTQVIFGVNLGANNTLNALNMAKSILAAFDAPEARAKNINLTFIEVGNEGDLYRHNGLRGSSYSPKEWIGQWTRLASNLSAELDFSSRSTRFWGPSFAFSGGSNAGWSPKNVLNLGLRSSPAGQLMQAISQHHYSGSFCFGGKSVAQDLMLKANVRGNLSAFIPDISAAHQQNLDYVLGETNSISCHGAPGVSDSAAAAIWHVDYSLFAATLGIKRMFFHEGVGYKYSLIQPVRLTRDIEHGTNLTQPLPPHVQPQYYGALIVADVIGTSGGATVVEIPIASHSYLSGYAIYENQTLKRAVFIHSRVWAAADDQADNTRPSTHLSFTGLTSSENMIVRRLAMGHSDDTYPTANITWAGISYNSTNGLPIGSENTSSGLISDGVSIAASEVIMLSFS